jgi:hypothetical protein
MGGGASKWVAAGSARPSARRRSRRERAGRPAAGRKTAAEGRSSLEITRGVGNEAFRAGSPFGEFASMQCSFHLLRPHTSKFCTESFFPQNIIATRSP